MSFEDKIFWLVITMPIIQNLLCFIVGAVFGIIILALLSASRS